MDFKSIFENAPSDEKERQYYFIDAACRYMSERMETNKLTFCVSTFGCQMNARDSEKISGILERVGYVETEDEKSADFVVYNTCTVRDNANQRLLGRLGSLLAEKKKRPGMRVAICGCMSQEVTARNLLLSKYRKVDLIFGTHNVYKFAELLCRLYMRDECSEGRNLKTICEIEEDAKCTVEELPIKRNYAFKSGVNIMYGCNNFCTYCIVPFVRGRERSRNSAEILAEVRNLAACGIKEVMLLGQNVNSYGNSLADEMSFPQLLSEVEKIEGIERIRFMTSHPKDLSDELIEVMKNSTKICRHLHLPLQSGSTRILREMNRRYTKESYLDLVDRIRKEIPDISITTDIIIGFPGEKQEDVDETIDVIRKAQFEGAFTFIYSKRSGTKAADMPNQVPYEEAKKQFDRVLSVVNEVSQERAQRLQGKVMDVLVEEINRQDDTLVTGRLSNNLVVHFPGDSSLIGKIVNVKLTQCMGFYYLGNLLDENK